MDSSKKNLLLMVPMLHQGGFERVCVTTARLMQDLYNVHIVIFSSKDINYDITGIDVIDIDVPAKKGIVNKLVNMAKRVHKVKVLKKKLGTDISYSFGSSANYVNVLSKGKEKVLTGIRCQTDLENQREVSLFCRKSDQVLSCSKEIMRQLSADFDYHNSTYIYNPLDVNDINNKASEHISDYPFTGDDLKTIVCMGRNDYIKGIWHLLKAFSLVYKKHPNARLLVVGAGNWSSYVSMARSMGLEKVTSFPGVRKNPFPYVKKSDIYVCSSNHEGFPNAVLEAMALGKPVISADCKTGPREILLSEEEYKNILADKPNGDSITDAIEGTYGILVPDMDQAIDMDPGNICREEIVLAEAISDLLEHEEKLRHFEKKAHERALFYEPSRYKNSIHEIFAQYE